MPFPIAAAAAILGPALMKAAPELVGRIFGPGGEAAAEAVVSTVGRVTGLPIDSAEDAAAAAAAIEADAELRARLRVELAEIGLREIALHNADRADARARDVALGGGNVRANAMLVAAFAAVVSIAAVWAAVIVWAPQEAQDEVQGLMGFLAGIGGMFARNIGSAFDFEFGSSRGSREKTGAIERMGKGIR